jgi:hypothetical protein
VPGDATNRNRIRGSAGRRRGRISQKSYSIKDQYCKSGGCAITPEGRHRENVPLLKGRHEARNDRGEIADLLLADTVAKHVKSNAIVFARNGATVGIETRERSRMDSLEIAAAKAAGMGAAAGISEPPTNTNIVLGRIVHAHVDPSVWKNGRVDPKLLDPVCRLSGSGYAALGDLVNVQRPQWKDIRGTVGTGAMPRGQRR